MNDDDVIADIETGGDERASGMVLCDVTGPRSVYGAAPGGTIELSEADATRLAASGHVTPKGKG